MDKKRLDWFQEKLGQLKTGIASLNPDDNAWVDKEYKAWHKETIQKVLDIH